MRSRAAEECGEKEQANMVKVQWRILADIDIPALLN